VSFAEEHQKKPSKIMQVFTGKANSYKIGSFDYNKNPNLVINMLLNNMKIEGQEVDKEAFLKLLDESNPS